MLTIEDYLKMPYAIKMELDECGGKPCYMAYHPELRGCMAQGWTQEEALENLIEARRDYIALLLERNLEPPLPAIHKTVYRALERV